MNVCLPPMFQRSKASRSSLPNTPQPKDLKFKAWKLDPTTIATSTPRLSFTDLPSSDMDGTPFSKPQSSFSSPSLLNTHPTSAQRAEDIGTTTTVSDGQPSVSGGLRQRAISVTPTVQAVNASSLSPAVPTPKPPPLGPVEDGLPDNDSPPWCGAVGRASLGKSGRVIERLMSDIDKLKRELKAEISHRQEIEKRESTSTRAMDALKSDNSNLQLAKDLDATTLKRRDRKIEDLKAELDAERKRRRELEVSNAEAQKARDEALARERKEVNEAREIAKRATCHADVLESSHRQLSTEYKQRVATFQRDIARIAEDRDEERRKVNKHDSIVEQLKQEHDRVNKLNKEYREMFEAYKKTSELRISELEAKTGNIHEDYAKKMEDYAKKMEQMMKVEGEARWLINIAKNASKRSEYFPLDEPELGN